MGIEDRAVAGGEHAADRLGEPHLVLGERAPRRHVQHVPHAKPPDRQSTDGSLVGSIASRPSDDSDGIGSVSNVARPKNCRSAVCSRLSYSSGRKNRRERHAEPS